MTPRIHFARPARSARPLRRKTWPALLVERLEDRLAPAAGLPPDLVVGRTLSAYSTADVPNHALSVTYTVYNEQADEVTGVLLTDALRPGVTFAGATQPPDRSGQNLAWSLGTIPGYGRASVTLTVTLPAPVPLQIDAGATAFGTLDAGAVSADTPAATLVTRPVPAAALVSTPDANTTDPFVQEEAAKLRYDPQAIFDYLHTQVGYNSYTGSLRGARGTLWSGAGNSLDEASLGVALLRASGIPAGYAHGTLSDADARALILSMFPTNSQTVGYLPPGTPLADPANDPQLLAETKNHYWLRFDATGAGFVDADSSGLPGAAVGHAFTPAADTFTEVADGLRQKTEVALTAETYSPAAALFPGGNALTRTVVLDQTFDDVDLVGRPVTVGNFVSTNSIGIFGVGRTIYTYAPYLDLGDLAAADPGGDRLVTGRSYQEVLSILPLVSQVLTGLFLDITSVAPTATGGVSTDTVDKALLDRIGYAARQTGTATAVSVSAGDGPALTDEDITTLDVDPDNAVPAGVQLAQFGRLARVGAALAAVAPAAGATVTPADIANAPRANALGLQTLLLGNFAVAATFDWESGVLTRFAAADATAVAYRGSPRVVALTARTTVDAAAHTASGRTDLDIVRDPVRAAAPPGQSRDAVATVQFLSGLIDSAIEDQVLGDLAAPDGAGSTGVVTATGSLRTFVAALQAPGVRLAAIDQSNLTALAGLGISAEAKARITQDVRGGNVVLVPTGMLARDGGGTIAWLSYDPAAGTVIAVSEDGGHESSTVEVAGVADADLSLIEGETAGQRYAIQLYQRAKALQKEGKFSEAKDLLKSIGGINPTVFGVALSAVAIDFKVDALLRPVTQGGKTISVLLRYDPPADGLLFQSDTLAQNPDDESLPGPLGSAAVARPATGAAGTTQAAARTSSVAAAGGLSAGWSGLSATTFPAAALRATAAVLDGTGTAVGTGAVVLALPVPAAATVVGNVQYAVTGTGSLAFYGPAGPTLGVAGTWDSYTAIVTGGATITLTVPAGALTLDGTALPAGTYTLTTASATLSGSGNTSAPSFAGSASLTVTNGTLTLGPGSGPATVGGGPLDLTNGATLDGYTGTVGVAAAGSGLDAVSLAGTAASVLSVSAAPAAITADQNSPAAFRVNVNTSLADTYAVSALAPDGWTVAVDAAGTVTVTPAPGTQGGTFAVRVVVTSGANARLVAQTMVPVTVTPTVAGIAFGVPADPLFTVPYDGAEIPSAFRATVRNLGPAADTYAVTAANLPAGFTLLASGTTVAVPAGQTGVLGLYLQPAAGTALPAPGTVLTFTVTAASTTDPALSRTVTVTFTMPEVHAVTLTPTGGELSIPPGQSAAADGFTLTNAGNVAETVTTTVTGAAGLTLSQTPPAILLDPGETIHSFTPAVVTVDAAATLNSIPTGSVTIGYGPAAAPLTQTVPLPILVAAPNVADVTTAAATAAAAGLTALTARVDDLADALNRLYLDPTDSVARGQALAAYDALAGFAAADPYLVDAFSSSPTIVADTRARLVAATTPTNLAAAYQSVAYVVRNLSQTEANSVGYGFTLAASPNVVGYSPGAAAVVPLDFTDTGTQPVTLTLYSRNNQATFNHSTVTLQPGQTLLGLSPGGVLATVSAGLSITVPTNVGVSVTEFLPGGGRLDLNGTITLVPRAEVVTVASVAPAPAFAAAGTPVTVTAQVLAAVNAARTATATLTVRTAGGSVVRTLTAPVAIGVASALTPVTFPALDTTGLADGDYTLTVSVAETDGTAIPGATAGVGHLLVGLPVTGTVATSPATVLPGTITVTTTVTLNSSTAFPNPLTLTGQVATTPTSNSAVVVGGYAYVPNTTGIDVVDVSDPAAPRLVATFGQTDIVHAGATTIQRLGANDLVVATAAVINAAATTLLVYDLSANPQAPVLVSTTAVPYTLVTDIAVQGTLALISTAGYGFFLSGGTAFNQFGDVVALDLSDPAHPAVVKAVENTAHPTSGTTHKRSVVFVTPTTAYVAGTTSTGGNTQAGVGQVLVVDASVPANTAVTAAVPVPNTNRLLGVAVQGGRGLAVGSTGGPVNPSADYSFPLTGHLTLDVLDASAPTAPALTGAQVVIDLTFDGNGDLSVLPLGGTRFAVSRGLRNGRPVLLIVDVADPGHVAVAAVPVPAVVYKMAVVGNLLYTTSASGLLVYTVGSLVADPVTVSVRVPTGAGVAVVPGSFDIPPSRVVPGAGFDTLEWDRTLAFGQADQTFTFQSRVTGLAAGQAATVTAGGGVSFTDRGTAGMFALPATTVTAAQVLAFTPPAVTVPVGSTAVYTVVVSNPTATAQTYSLRADGLADDAVTLTGAAVGGVAHNLVAVPAGGTATVTLTLPADDAVAAGGYQFVLSASSYDGTYFNFASSALGYLTVTPATPDPNAHGVVAALTPATATAGQGTPATYTLTLTNTGSGTENFALSAAGLPAGVTAAFYQNGIPVASIAVPPGASNSRKVTLVLTPPAGTPAGSLPFTVTATAAGGAAGSAPGTLAVVASGVTVALDRTTGVPGDTLRATVTNTGTATDTFDLTVAGPAGLVATLGATNLTLAAGESTTVTVTTGAAAFAVAGELRLTVTARSHTDPAVAATAGAGLVVPPTVGLTATGPAAESIPAPGPVDFLVTVYNTGNTEDAYIATIVGTSGPVTAYLVGLDGLPTQAVPVFRLPGLSTGTLLVHSSLIGTGAAAVTISIRSLNDPTRTAIVTVAETAGSPSTPPIPPTPPPTTPPTVPPVPVVPPTVPSVPVVPPAVPPVPVVPPTVPPPPLVPVPPPATTPPPPPGPPPVVYDQIYAIGAGPGGGPRVQVFDAVTGAERLDFFAYDSTLRGGVSVATADVTGDGTDDVITGAGYGGAAHVKVFDGATGGLIADWFAYDPGFRGGVWVAAADLDGDGVAEVVTGPGLGGGPIVEVWSVAGGLPVLRTSFAAFDPGLRGGATVAAWAGAGGRGVIAAGSGPGSAPRVRTFDADSLAVLTDVAPFEATFTGGVYVAAGPGPADQLVVGPGPGGGPRLEVFAADGTTAADLLVDTDTARSGLTVASLVRPTRPARILFGAGRGAFTSTLASGTVTDLAPAGYFEPGFDGGVFVG